MPELAAKYAMNDMAANSFLTRTKIELISKPRYDKSQRLACCILINKTPVNANPDLQPGKWVAGRKQVIPGEAETVEVACSIQVLSPYVGFK
jgi:hypothetical protein